MKEILWEKNHPKDNSAKKQCTILKMLYSILNRYLNSYLDGVLKIQQWKLLKKLLVYIQEKEVWVDKDEKFHFQKSRRREDK